MIGNDSVSPTEITQISQTTRDDALFIPPLTGIDEFGLVPRHLLKKFGGLRVFLLAA
ncbi:hypothetical protein D3C80_1644210 [compost metagenome]